MFLVIGLAVFSCSTEETESKDDQFCACLTATGDLNEISSKFMDGEITLKAEQQVKKLRAKKDSICKPYTKLSGEENRKKQALCFERLK